jgi:CheY-like chemotaxis protein
MTDLSSTATDSAVRPGILVVDDDALLLQLLETVLTRRGFRVWTAPAGPDAVELLRQHQAEVALALLDVCMPGLDGPHTLAELRRVDPGVRACFMSGYTGHYAPEELLGLGVLRFFDKPFVIHDLAEELWRLAQEGRRRSA